MSKNLISGIFSFFSALLIVFISGRDFLRMREKEPVFPSTGLSRQQRLSDYYPALRGSPSETEIYVFEGKERGGHVLILGGTHPNEPAGLITAVLLVENLRAEKGKIIIVPRANASGFTHSDPQEGNPQKYFIETPKGKRWFRFGSRLTNPVHQWPDPTIYINPAGEKLSGSDSRNLNRCYPGRKKGYLTEKVASAVIELIKKEKIDLAVDVHEAAPEYPVINAFVFHEKSADLASLALLKLQDEGIDTRLEASPPSLRGLSHREWGDHAGILAILMESANPSQGRLKGKPSPSLIIKGKDKNYAQASKLRRLFVPYPREGIPLRVRVARHLASLNALFSSLGEIDPDKEIKIGGLPSATDVQNYGVGTFLHPPYSD